MAVKQNEPDSGVVTGPPNGPMQGYRRGLDSGTSVDPVGREIEVEDYSGQQKVSGQGRHGYDPGIVHTDAARGTPSAMAGVYRDTMDHPVGQTPNHAGFASRIESEQAEEIPIEGRANLPVVVPTAQVSARRWQEYAFGPPGMAAATLLILAGSFMIWRKKLHQERMCRDLKGRLGT